MRRLRVLTRIFPASSIEAAQLTTEKGEPMKSNESKRNLHVGAAFVSILGALGACQVLLEAGSQGPTVQAPRFEVDPLWPKPLPNHCLLGWATWSGPGVARDRATSGRKGRTASTSITRATSGSAATARGTPTS